jgi:hypothetical protein
MAQLWIEILGRAKNLTRVVVMYYSVFSNVGFSSWGSDMTSEVFLGFLGSKNI